MLKDSDEASKRHGDLVVQGGSAQFKYLSNPLWPFLALDPSQTQLNPPFVRPPTPAGANAFLKATVNISPDSSREDGNPAQSVVGFIKATMDKLIILVSRKFKKRRPLRREASAPFRPFPVKIPKEFDQMAAHVSPHPGEGWRDFTWRLVKHVGAEGNTLLTLRAVYVWLTINVDFDHDSIGDNCQRRKLQGCEWFLSDARRNRAMDAIIQNRLAVCAGYAYMFQRMCMHAGIDGEVRYVVGYTKLDGITAFNVEPGVVKHARNIVFLPDRDPMMVDCTWSSLLKEKTLSQETVAIDDTYWMVNPYYSIHHFLPFWRASQCIHDTWSLKRFCHAPNLYPDFFHFRLHLEDRDSIFAEFALRNQPRTGYLHIRLIERGQDIKNIFIHAQYGSHVIEFAEGSSHPVAGLLRRPSNRTETEKATLFEGKVPLKSFIVDDKPKLAHFSVLVHHKSKQHMAKVMTFLVVYKDDENVAVSS